MLVRKICAILFVLTSLAALSGVSASSGAQLRVQIVDARGLPVRDAVVEVDPASGQSGAIRFPWRMAMAQKDQTFVPGTLIVAKGSTVAFPNLDTVRHSIYSFSKAARFKIDLYGRDQTRTKQFAVSGSVALGCNIHDQMRGYIRVVDTPYAGKTDSNGLIALSGLPTGKATVTIWHPRLRAPNGEFRKAVDIGNANSPLKLPLKFR